MVNRWQGLFFLSIIGLFTVLIVIRQPPLGITILISAGLIAPFSIGTGSQSSINATMLFLTLLISLWVLDMVVRQHKFYVLPSLAIKTVFIFIIVTLLSFGFGQLPWFPISPAPLRAQLGGLAIYLLSAGAFLVVAHQIREIRGLQSMTLVFHSTWRIILYWTTFTWSGSIYQQIISVRFHG